MDGVSVDFRNPRPRPSRRHHLRLADAEGEKEAPRPGNAPSTHGEKVQARYRQGFGRARHSLDALRRARQADEGAIEWNPYGLFAQLFVTSFIF